MQMVRGWMMGENLLSLWIMLFVVAGIAVGVVSGFFRARKIQPKGFSWKTFRAEAMFAILGTTISGTAIGGLTAALTANHLLVTSHEAVSWWVVAIEYGVYFVAFDTWFYWLHRWMHSEPMYSGIHKLHHLSTSPNLLTTLSVNPLESLINGGFVPLFLAAATIVALPIHQATLALLLPTNIVMGLYVHAGYEFLPRWWNKSWLTKWFITTTFHDQHHKYFNYNFGGYTTVWDRICGTVRSKYESDFETLRERNAKPQRAVQEEVVPAE